jgi:TusA-related sulfurtransferase
MNNTVNITQIDATGLTCPVPLMLLKKTLDELKGGDVVRIEVTDVHAELDFEIWCEKFGHLLEKIEDVSDVIRFTVTKASGM